MQADGKTAEDRFDGLLATMADFHVQMEVLSLLYKLAYHEGSSQDIGSLYSCRNLINAKTTKKASKDYFNNGEFADKVTAAYVNLGNNNFVIRAYFRAYYVSVSGNIMLLSDCH